MRETEAGDTQRTALGHTATTGQSGTPVLITATGGISPESPGRRKRVPAWVYVVASFAGGIGLYWLAAIALGSQFLPAPPAVASVFRQDLASGYLEQQAWASLERVLIGYLTGVAVSIPVGFLMGWYLWARQALEPWVQFLRVIPPLALIPIVITVIGIGQSARIFLIFYAAFLSTLIAVFQGVRSMDRTLVDAARVLGANDRRIFVWVVVPATVPYLLVGMRVALGNAWATLVAAELIASSSGLGYMMWSAQENGAPQRVMEGLITLGLIGVVMDRIVVYLNHRLTRWQDTREGAA